MNNVNDDAVLAIFRQTKALLEGHFELRSGLHSNQYFQCAKALQFMPIVEQIGAMLAGTVRYRGAVTVVSPAMGGLVGVNDRMPSSIAAPIAVP